MSTRASLAAWRDVQGKLGARQEQVLAIIKGGISGQPGATLREIADLLGLDMSGVSGRVTELQEMGLIVNSGQERVNPRSGKNITVWIPTAPKQIGLL